MGSKFNVIDVKDISAALEEHLPYRVELPDDFWDFKSKVDDAIVYLKEKLGESAWKYDTDNKSTEYQLLHCPNNKWAFFNPEVLFACENEAILFRLHFG